MQAIKFFTLIAVLIGSSSSSPVGTELFPGFYRNANLQAPSKEADINKRLAVEANADATLKQISLQGLIGDLEHSLFQSAISVSGVGQQEQSDVQEVTPTTTTAPASTPTAAAVTAQHDISKRNTVASEQSTSLADAVSSTTAANHVLLQTTKRVPETNGVPAHILIDRVSVQPHSGNLPLIPAFQLQHTKVVSATVKEANAAGNAAASSEHTPDATKISITQTIIKATSVRPSSDEQSASVKSEEHKDSTTTAAKEEHKDSSTTAAKEEHKVSTTTAAKSEEPKTVTVPAKHEEQQQSASDKHTESLATATASNSATPSTTSSPNTQTANGKDSTTTTTTPSTAATSSSTAKPLVELKKAEAELKEKVAEIEAEPVILSARV